MRTALCDRLGIEVPIIQAPMGGAVGPRLVAAVSNASGLGILALWRADTDTIRRQIRETHALTSRPLLGQLASHNSSLETGGGTMRYELKDHEWVAIKSMLSLLRVGLNGARPVS